MKQLVRKSMTVLLVLSAAGFLVTAARGQYGSPFFPAGNRQVTRRWSGDPDTVALVPGAVTGLASSAASAA